MFTPKIQSRLIVASNRLPVVVHTGPGAGPRQVAPASGGLVTALAPLLRQRGGSWFGWAGCSDETSRLTPLLEAASREAGYALLPIAVDRQEQQEFYQGFANEVIWPLFHSVPSMCNFVPAYWQAYRRVNARFGEAIARHAQPGDIVWVHDYQLMSVGSALRDHGLGSPVGFFLHIPFPAPDLFMNLPWRVPLLESLLDYDLVGFQTRRDRRNFLECLNQLLDDVSVTGRGQQICVVSHSGRRTRVGYFPISIDFNDFHQRASAPAVAARAASLQAILPNRQLLLGVDRLDYTKGIPQRLRAFEYALENHPELRERVTLIQVVVPSRAAIPRYEELKKEIERLVGRINGRFTKPGAWVPIHYVYRSLTPEELLAYYRAAHVALITPLRDGMNLVAKEYCVCSPDDEGVLILSEFAGAAMQLAGGAIIVNPHDIEAIATAISRAVTMAAPERRARMRRMRRSIRRHDVFWWAEFFLGKGLARNLQTVSCAASSADQPAAIE